MNEEKKKYVPDDTPRDFSGIRFVVGKEVFFCEGSNNKEKKEEKEKWVPDDTYKDYSGWNTYQPNDTIRMKSMLDGRIYHSKSEYYQSLKKKGRIIADDDYHKQVQKNRVEIINKTEKLESEYIDNVVRIGLTSTNEYEYNARTAEYDGGFRNKYNRELNRTVGERDSELGTRENKPTEESK